MRSRPANASLICVPIEAICTTGAAIRPGEDQIDDEVAERHRAGDDRAAADDDHDDADHADDDGRERGDRRHAGDRLGDVAEQPVNALREDQLFALLGGVGLDDADAAERFVQPAGHLGVDLSALAEERPQAVERQRHRAAECGQRAERRERQPPVQVEENDERDDGRDDAAGELDEAGADDVADAFGVRHDARDEDAGLRRVEVADRQPRDVRLDAPAHVGDRALRRDAEHLREREGRHRLDDRRRAGGERQRHQHLRSALADDVVDQELGGRGQDQARPAG